MMSDINCPYCDEPQEINHDDGYGYEENRMHEQQCADCGKTFGFTTSISFYYEEHKLDCKNGSDHNWKPTRTFPKAFTMMECKDCYERREPTDEERVQYNIPID
jgi:hypothetical protein